MNIGQKIRERREQLGYTQDELAKKLGYKSRSSVNKIENSREVSIKMIGQYAKALETSVAYLMDWEDKDIAKSAETDVILSNMDNKIKEYAIKLSKLPKDKQEHIMSLIDMLTK